MSFRIRESQFDVLIVAGPRVDVWPSVGARVLSVMCTDMGLKVGVLGGEGMKVLGVLPRVDVGAYVFVEDTQGRLHRMSARAVVKLKPEEFLPNPFPGWASEGVLPVSGAERLLALDRAVSWMPAVAILGSGNRAMRWGSQLLKKRLGSDRPEVWLIEPEKSWGLKPFAGWEVEFRRFQMAGGKVLQAIPQSITPISSSRFELRLDDGNGIRILEVAKLIDAGPYMGSTEGVREFPADSLLFEMIQTAVGTRENYAEGWFLEEERARFLATRIVKALVSSLGDQKEALENAAKKAKARLRLSKAHLDAPFQWQWDGKWLQSSQREEVRSWGGVPHGKEEKQAVAAIECFEEIGCRVCEKACPEKAILFTKAGRRGGEVLNEAACTGCAICVKECPSEAIVLLGPVKANAAVTLTLPWREREQWRVGEKVILLSRSGESLGQGRIAEVTTAPGEVPLVQVQVPSHLAWEVRSLRKAPEEGVKADDPDFRRAVEREQSDTRIEIFLNSEKRYVKPETHLIEAFRQIGHLRPRDMLACADGSCGRCTVYVDGIKRLACETPVRKGMSIRSEKKPAEPEEGGATVICPCEGITVDQVDEAIRSAHLSSPEAVIEATRMGRGRCHGQVCGEPFRRRLLSHGMQVADDWIDWRFPWRDWKMGSAEKGDN